MKTYLAHHGILGMKWGVRRYQNEDGSLTDLGKKHYVRLEYGKVKQSTKYEKASDKYSNEVYKHGAKAASMRSKAAKLKYDAAYGLVGSTKRRAKNLKKADKLNSKADKIMRNATKYEGLMKRAEAKIAQYDKELSSFSEAQIKEGQRAYQEWYESNFD